MSEWAVGIDAGIDSLKVALLSNGQVRYHGVHPEGNEPVGAILREALDRMWAQLGSDHRAEATFAATGVLAEFLPLPVHTPPAPHCLATGAQLLVPAAHTVVDFGAQRIMAIRCGEGRPSRVATSDRCAAGTGRYLKMVSQLLHVELDEMARLAKESTEMVSVHSTCAVFAESEIISLIHSGKAIADVLRGVFAGLAERAYKTLAQVGLEREIAVVGGVVRNKGVIRELEDLLGFAVLVPDDPEVVGAIGAAILADGLEPR